MWSLLLSIVLDIHDESWNKSPTDKEGFIRVSVKHYVLKWWDALRQGSRSRGRTKHVARGWDRSLTDSVRGIKESERKISSLNPDNWCKSQRVSKKMPGGQCELSKDCHSKVTSHGKTDQDLTFSPSLFLSINVQYAPCKTKQCQSVRILVAFWWVFPRTAEYVLSLVASKYIFSF